MKIQDLLSHFDDVRPSGNGWLAKCPAHDDHNPSLSVSNGDDGRILIHCHRDCKPEEIVESMGLSMADLFPGSNHGNSRQWLSPEQVLELVARRKKVQPASLKEYGAEVRDQEVVLPMYGPDLRPCSEFRLSAKGGKGRNASGKPRGLFFPGRFPKPGETWYITEGPKDSAALHNLGFLAAGLPSASMDPRFAPLFKDVDVVLMPDRDAGGENGSQKSARVLYGFAKTIHIVTLPAEFSDKNGPDIRDVLAKKNGEQDLLAAIEKSEPWEPPRNGNLGPYIETADGIIWNRITPRGELIPTPLSNFNCIIKSDLRLDDGLESRHVYELAVQLNGISYEFQVRADQFDWMNWVANHLPARAIVYPGYRTKQHLATAIRTLSGSAPERIVYTHLGWRMIDGEEQYLHAGGGISKTGFNTDIIVALSDDLARFSLPDPPEGDALKAAVTSSLRLPKIMPLEVGIPLLAAVYGAAIGGERLDFSVFIVGPTGVFKTAIAALAQQHYGAELSALNLPGNWDSTANALQHQAFVTKDALLVVDDFTPGGDSRTVTAAHREADRLLRAQGNRASRKRLKPDATLRPTQDPRGLILSTGEDIPQGQSLRARIIVLELAPGDIKPQLLTDCQQQADNGLFSSSMAGFLQWLASQRRDVLEGLNERIVELRKDFIDKAPHLHIATSLAQLLGRFEILLKFACDVGAIDSDVVNKLREKAHQALSKVGASQKHYLTAEDPAEYFLQLIGSAITSGVAHVADRNGEAPNNAEIWGWRLFTRGTGDFREKEWRPKGRLIGWIDETYLYLDPCAAFAEAQRLARAQGSSLPVTLIVLEKRLKQRGFLKQWEQKRDSNRVRKTLAGKQRAVLVVGKDDI